MELIEYIEESSQALKIKPMGFVDKSEFSSDKYDDYKYILLQCIAIHTQLNRNSLSDANLWEELFLDKDFNLVSKKKTTIGRTERKIKTKVISTRNVSSNKEEILNILFGKDADKSLCETFDSLVNFIVSSDYKNRNNVSKIFKTFVNKCAEDPELNKKLYKIKPWLKSKFETIL